MVSLPVDMHATYIRILRLIGEQHQSLKEIVKEVLMWLVSAGRPLSPEELALTVAITPESRNLSDICGKYLPKTVIEACRNFVTVDAEEVRFIHFTVQEFLTSSLSSDALLSEVDGRLLHQDCRVVLKDAQAVLVKRLVQLMLFEDMKDLPPGEYPTAVWKLDIYIFQYAEHHIRVLELQLNDVREIVDLLSGGPNTNPPSLCLALHLVDIFGLLEGPTCQPRILCATQSFYAMPQQSDQYLQSRVFCVLDLIPRCPIRMVPDHYITHVSKQILRQWSVCSIPPTL